MKDSPQQGNGSREKSKTRIDFSGYPRSHFASRPYHQLSPKVSHCCSQIRVVITVSQETSIQVKRSREQTQHPRAICHVTESQAPGILKIRDPHQHTFSHVKILYNVICHCAISANLHPAKHNGHGRTQLKALININDFLARKGRSRSSNVKGKHRAKLSWQRTKKSICPTSLYA